MGIRYNAPRFTALSEVGFPMGTVVEPAGRVVAYVRSTGAQDDDPRDIQEKLVTTLEAALPRCRANMGDTIVLLRGHSETLASDIFDGNLVAGTRIIGAVPAGSPDAPTLTLGGVTDLDVAVDNVRIENVRFGVATAGDGDIALDITGDNAVVRGCWFEYADASNSMDTCIGVSGDDALIAGNVFRGVTTAPGTAPIEVNACDGATIVGNLFIGPCVAATGHISIAAAATNLYIADNDMSNTTAASTACISVADAASTGILARNMMAVLNDGTAAAQGIIFTGSGSLIKAFDNKCCDEPRKSGVLAPAAVAT